jgi:hypothetical protein
MPYSIVASPNEDIVSVVHTGTVSIDELENVVSELEERFRGKSLQGLLVDTRGVESGPEVSEYVVWARGRGDKPWIARKMALLTGDGFAEIMSHVSMAAQSMGAAVWSFADEAEALDWLARPIGSEQ